MRPTQLIAAAAALLLAGLIAPAAAQEPPGDAAEAQGPSPEVVSDGDAAASDEPIDAAANEGPQAEPTAAGAESEDARAEEPAGGIDWAGLVERAPAFLAVTHHAAVHLPIALWLFGALFVAIGVVVPSVRNQVPVACLIGGAITSVAAAASGWWYAEYSWGEPWAWGDGLGEFDDHLVKHRWVGVGLVIASVGLSIVAIVSQVRRSRRLGAFWRLGLVGLAVAVAWEGHLGGELIQGEGFLEEAFQEWIHPGAAE
ncbi:MAG: hypothetical protein AAF805_05225 [Planctomycetota bacterium]